MEFVHVELKRDTWVTPEMNIRNPEDAVTAVQALIQNLDRELVVCIHTSTSGRVINASVCAMGTMDQALVSPSEVLRTAILSGAHGILMLHNHPSGSCKTSTDDLHLAKKLATACALMGLQLIDFIVIGAYGYTHSVKNNEEEWIRPSHEWLSAGMVSENRGEKVEKSRDNRKCSRPNRTADC